MLLVDEWQAGILGALLRESAIAADAHDARAVWGLGKLQLMLMMLGRLMLMMLGWFGGSGKAPLQLMLMMLGRFEGSGRR